jgi:hypothetical protein
MTREEAISRLEAYEGEAKSILSRFVNTSDSLSIATGDRGRLEQMIIEIRDLFDDFLGSNSYSSMIVGAYNEGIANYYHSPSYNSVQRIGGIVSAALVRIKGNPDLGKPVQEAVIAPPEPPPAPVALPLEAPEKVTLRWLADHVPISMWIMLGGALFTAFTLGITAAKLSIIQEWFGIVPAQSQGSKK